MTWLGGVVILFLGLVLGFILGWRERGQYDETKRWIARHFNKSEPGIVGQLRAEEETGIPTILQGDSDCTSRS